MTIDDCAATKRKREQLIAAARTVTNKMPRRRRRIAVMLSRVKQPDAFSAAAEYYLRIGVVPQSLWS